MRTAVLLGLFAGGCGLSVVGVAMDGVDVANPADASMDVSIDALADAEGADGDVVGPDATVVDATVDVDATIESCIAASCEGKRCVDGGCEYFPDCRRLRDGFGADSGPYVFHGPDGGAFSAHCEMALADGGWTLVGQSAAGATSNSFGWTSETGTLGDQTKPYSINAIGRGLAINEVLAVRGTRAAPIAAYLIRPPANFPTGFATAGALVGSRTRVLNPSCPGDGAEPNMLGNMGHTDRAITFWFRDFPQYDTNYGLNPNGWRLNYPNNCQLAGDFDGEQGLLYVR